MSVGRWFHTATLLPSGKVLVVGGQIGGTEMLSSCELYDPTTGTWSFADSLNIARTNHTATPLTNGKLLVAGGGYPEIYSCEVYEPTTDTWSITGSMNFTHREHTATLLPNDEVLVNGLSDDTDYLFCELYNQTTGTWTAAASMNTASRCATTATLLRNGKVLVAGGSIFGSSPSIQLDSCELYASSKK